MHSLKILLTNAALRALVFVCFGTLSYVDRANASGEASHSSQTLSHENSHESLPAPILQTMPTDAVVHIMGWLSSKDIAKSGQTCRHFLHCRQIAVPQAPDAVQVVQGEQWQADLDELNDAGDLDDLDEQQGQQEQGPYYFWPEYAGMPHAQETIKVNNLPFLVAHLAPRDLIILAQRLPYIRVRGLNKDQQRDYLAQILVRIPDNELVNLWANETFAALAENREPTYVLSLARVLEKQVTGWLPAKSAELDQDDVLGWMTFGYAGLVTVSSVYDSVWRSAFQTANILEPRLASLHMSLLGIAEAAYGSSINSTSVQILSAVREATGFSADHASEAFLPIFDRAANLAAQAIVQTFHANLPAALNIPRDRLAYRIAERVTLLMHVKHALLTPSESAESLAQFYDDISAALPDAMPNIFAEENWDHWLDAYLEFDNVNDNDTDLMATIFPHIDNVFH